ncbi:tripartite motif-containing protein 2-like isoform X2 [Liolophura sinensis]|uniref:tripartite motif-containing protein 2-like isoform X2 n=1 Tax=Liolophura sinensis TaxID=3198878 RepID=UPI0031587BAC
MVDNQAHNRLYTLRPLAPEICLLLQRELFSGKYLHLLKKTWITTIHDCRPEVIKDHVDRRDWETQLLCHGLRKTCADLGRLRTHRKTEDNVKRKDKLLFQIGVRGNGEGDFCYPRALVVTDTGDLIIVDTANNRVQVLNPYGVFKFSFGTKGEANGEFNEPTGVAVLPNGRYVVADSKNRRIQVFHRNGRFDQTFSTNGVPYSVSCDRSYNIVVGTTARSVEIYSRDGKFVRKFRTSESTRGKGFVPVYVRCNRREEIVVLDPEEKLVKFYTQKGRFLRHFQPELGDDGLAMTASCICLDSKDRIIIGDSLNHTISVYDDTGDFLGQILGPYDSLGPVQSCDIGPEGHLGVTEFSVTGEHCVKIFRFVECICHLNRPGSTKRRTLTNSAEKEHTLSRSSSNSPQ